MSYSTSMLLKYLDAPVRLLSFTAGDLAAMLAPFFIGALFDSLFVIPVAGLLLIALLKKLLKPFPKFYGIRFLYWSLPTRRFNRILRVNLPPSHQRFWIK